MFNIYFDKSHTLNLYSWNRYFQVATHINKNVIINIKPDKIRSRKNEETQLGFCKPKPGLHSNECAISQFYENG
jgi:hypothetical protein